MTDIRPNFQKALTNVEDGIEENQQSSPNRDNLDYFVEEARTALDDFPADYPYVEEFNRALDDANFEVALDELANLAAYVQEHSDAEPNVEYSSLAVDRIQDSHRDRC